MAMTINIPINIIMFYCIMGSLVIIVPMAVTFILLLLSLLLVLLLPTALPILPFMSAGTTRPLSFLMVMPSPSLTILLIKLLGFLTSQPQVSLSTGKPPRSPPQQCPSYITPIVPLS
jgi:hypothetical protein